jgi:predicted transcriptional regulator
MNQTSLGDQELAILRHISERAPISAGEVSAVFGEQSGLARSTIETVLERLRKKGYLVRHRQKGVFRYEPTVAPNELMGGLVGQFVEKTLAGSLTPFVTYFSSRNRLSDEELEQLKALVGKLQEGSTK